MEKTEFTRPMLYNPDGFVLPKSWTAGTTDHDLAGKRLGVIKGTAYIEYLKAKVPSAKLVEYENFNALKSDLIAGRLDLSYGSRLTYELNLTSRPEGAGWKIMPIDYSDKDIIRPLFSWAVQKGNVALRDRVNVALEAMIADCTYTQIRKQYFPSVGLEEEPARCQ